MPSQPKAGAVIYAKDILRVGQFYAGTMDFEVVHAEADHLVLESPVFQLVVLAIPSAIGSTIEVADPPMRRTDVAIKPVFYVPSIAAVREAAARLGGQLNPREQEWRFQQAVVCDGHDPEGNVLQFRQTSG
ncbi:glyoxalase/bleomycin resistance/dioxygenase family protein [Rhodanobacter ginsengiterrae]|uniref:glyoxalase/bleomycin resistance/dioxygenase family protein n=1 Tax=Rhodanobacter ginsengiterrae TaxID=2008451 RepID=UPI003CF8D9FC